MSAGWGGDLVVNPIVFITNPGIGTIVFETLAISVAITTVVF